MEGRPFPTQVRLVWIRLTVPSDVLSGKSDSQSEQAVMAALPDGFEAVAVCNAAVDEENSAREWQFAIVSREPTTEHKWCQVRTLVSNKLGPWDRGSIRGCFAPDRVDAMLGCLEKLCAEQDAVVIGNLETLRNTACKVMDEPDEGACPLRKAWNERPVAPWVITPIPGGFEMIRGEGPRRVQGPRLSRRRRAWRRT
jgi:hypothetical protein